MNNSIGNKNIDNRANDILEVIMSYARLEFDHKLPLSEKGDVFDAIASGVNMLGEELNENVVSLKEKEQLLKEIHHRVKNNMQIISSMLRLQFSKEEDERVIASIEDSQNRIYAMALVHEMLYKNAQFKNTNFNDYLIYLTKSIFTSYAPKNHQIELVIDISENTYFEIDKMIPLGLMINEMITNSLKYAFLEKNTGKIEITSSVGDNNFFIIKVKDNGKGLGTNFAIEKHGNLGMQLIYLLADQIDAEIEMIQNNGLGYIVKLIK